VTDGTFLRDRLGFGPSAYVEKQAAPVGQVTKPDRFYWAEQRKINGDDALVDDHQEGFKQFLSLCVDASDRQIDKQYTQEIRRALDNSAETRDWVIFCRNLLDLMVHSGGASTFYIVALEAMLNAHPEGPEARDARRALLMKTRDLWTAA
jgi:hypothetical protein